jgi:hypothetical protein
MKYILISGLNEAELFVEFGYKQYLIDRGHEVCFKLITNSNLSKNYERLSFLDRITRYLYFVEKSRYIFSYYHAVFERISLANPIHLILNQYIGRFFRNNPIATINIRHAIEKIRVYITAYKFNKNKDGDIYVFFNIISTKIELDHFYEAVYLNKRRVLIQTYWDNITSKIYIPSQEFDNVICWGDESIKNYLEVNKFSKSKFSLAFPYRCNYLKSVINNDNRNLILYAPSQKKLSSDIDNLNTLDRVVTKLNSQGGDQYSVIYRPHPYSSSKDLPCLKNFKNITIDSAFLNLNIKDTPFANHKYFKENSYASLIDNLNKTCCLLSQAGTLCLEARALSINVFVLLNEPYQVTLKFSQYMTHFNDLFSDPGVYPIYSQNQLEIKLLSLNLSRKNPVSDFVKNSLVFEPDLGKILEKVNHYK